ncbi:MAG: glycosyltransferase family 2 protein [Ferruginibacter sp.]|nr:glycosyltransferase family 2 protein [Ferruginibacter sp.]
MANSYPLVSILMTAYNREQYIAEAIESVLASAYTNFELIIVDDASSDKTVAIAGNFAARDERIHLYVNEHNLGDYPNRNKAASYAKGEYLKYLDSDDKIYPYTLNIMVDAMENNPEAVLGLCYFRIQDDTKAFPIMFSPQEAYNHHFFKGGLLFTGPSGAIIHREYFMTTGGFSGKRYVSDYELWLKIVQQTPVLIFQPALIWWRRHAGQEFNLGHLNEEYVMLNYELNKAYLETPDCPLKEKDRRVAIRNYRNLFARKIIKKMAYAHFKDALIMKKYSGMGISDILKGFIPINKIKKLFT